jgi:hypothetical protein
VGMAAVALPPQTLTVNASSVAPGGLVTMHLAGGFGGASDWISLAQVGSADNTYVQYTWVGTNVTTRDWTVTMPTTPGNYEFRFFPNNTYTHISTSPPVTVTAAVLPPTTLTVNTTSVTQGGSVTVTLTGGYGGGLDYIALAAVGAPNSSYLQYTWVGSGVTTRTWTVAMPTTPGNYEFRFFPNNTYNLVATSPTVTVTGQQAPTPVFSLSATSVPRGGTVTVTLTNCPGGSLDWIALAAVGAPETNYVQYTWVGGGVTTKTWVVTMPTTPGNYEFRFYLNNNYVRIATSATVSVGP